MNKDQVKKSAALIEALEKDEETWKKIEAITAIEGSFYFNGFSSQQIKFLLPECNVKDESFIASVKEELKRNLMMRIKAARETLYELGIRS